eukprot:249505-Pyramimonas_sp.AAC.1
MALLTTALSEGSRLLSRQRRAPRAALARYIPRQAPAACMPAVIGRRFPPPSQSTAPCPAPDAAP